jgi:SAM-dependent methyltransferase
MAGPTRPTHNDLALIRDTYGRVAERYADAFLDELTAKPLDRALLTWFADDVRARGGGHVLDLGTGSGQVARFLNDRGIAISGLDLAPEMVEVARARHPGVAFVTGDLLALDAADGAYTGLTAFYAIVHLEHAGLARACAEAHRVLAPGGALLLAFHVGEDALTPDDFLGQPCPIHWNFFPMAVVVAAVERAGLTAEVRVERMPYPSEHPSARGYLLARKPAA